MSQTLIDISHIKDYDTARAVDALAQTVQAGGLGGATTAVKYNTNTATSGTTLTAANITGGSQEVYLNLTGTLGGDANAQLPLVTDVVAAISSFVAGQSYILRVVNSSSANHVWTITTNTGWTLAGTMTIAQNTFRDFVVTMTSATAATLQSVGTGTTS